MWWVSGCGPAAVAVVEVVGESRAVGAGDRLWWTDGDGLWVGDPVDGRVTGRWTGDVDDLVAEGDGAWIASGEALVRVDAAGGEVGRWASAGPPVLTGGEGGVWVGWSDGLWRCALGACRRTGWRDPVDAIAVGDGPVVLWSAGQAIGWDGDAVAWTRAAPLGAPVIARDTLVVAESEAVYALDVADGAARWRAPWAAGADPAAVGGWVVLADADTVTALGAASGGPRWWRDRADTRALIAGPDWTVAAWAGATAEIVDVASGDPIGALASETPPVALPCGWATVVDGAPRCQRW